MKKGSVDVDETHLFADYNPDLKKNESVIRRKNLATSTEEKHLENQTLLQFVPGVIKEYFNTMVEDDNKDLQVPLIQDMHGAILFIDVAKYTNLTVQLAHYVDGAGHLALIINKLFHKILERAKLYNADVLKFAGDAMIMMFPYDNLSQQNKNRRIYEAVCFANDTHRDLFTYELPHSGDNKQVAERITPKVKIGVSCGRVTIYHIGGSVGLLTDTKLEYIAAGNPLNEAFAAEGKCQPGETMITADVQKIVHKYFKLDFFGERRGSNTSSVNLSHEAQSKPSVLQKLGSSVRRKKSRKLPRRSFFPAIFSHRHGNRGSFFGQASTPERQRSPSAFSITSVAPQDVRMSFYKVERQVGRMPVPVEEKSEQKKREPSIVMVAKNPLQEDIVQLEEVSKLVCNYLPLSVLPYLNNVVKATWLSELRFCTTVFINLELPPATLAKFIEHKNGAKSKTLNKVNSLYQTLQAAVSNYEGTVNKFLVDDKGWSILAVFGLPPFATDLDADKALLCSMMVLGLLKELKVGGNVGISTGKVYTGVVGSSVKTNRREYSVMGASINTASRLMVEAKKGSILFVDENTKLSLRDDFDLREVRLTLKGVGEVYAFYPGRAKLPTKQMQIAPEMLLTDKKPKIDPIRAEIQGILGQMEVEVLKNAVGQRITAKVSKFELDKSRERVLAVAQETNKRLISVDFKEIQSFFGKHLANWKTYVDLDSANFQTIGDLKHHVLKQRLAGLDVEKLSHHFSLLCDDVILSDRISIDRLKGSFTFGLERTHVNLWMLKDSDLAKKRASFLDKVDGNLERTWLSFSQTVLQNEEMFNNTYTRESLKENAFSLCDRLEIIANEYFKNIELEPDTERAMRVAIVQGAKGVGKSFGITSFMESVQKTSTTAFVAAGGVPYKRAEQDRPFTIYGLIIQKLINILEKVRPHKYTGKKARQEFMTSLFNKCFNKIKGLRKGSLSKKVKNKSRMEAVRKFFDIAPVNNKRRQSVRPVANAPSLATSPPKKEEPQDVKEFVRKNKGKNKTYFSSWNVEPVENAFKTNLSSEAPVEPFAKDKKTQEPLMNGLNTFLAFLVKELRQEHLDTLIYLAHIQQLDHSSLEGLTTFMKEYKHLPMFFLLEVQQRFITGPGTSRISKFLSMPEKKERDSMSYVEQANLSLIEAIQQLNSHAELTEEANYTALTKLLSLVNLEDVVLIEVHNDLEFTEEMIYLLTKRYLKIDEVVIEYIKKRARGNFRFTEGILTLFKLKEVTSLETFESSEGGVQGKLEVCSAALRSIMVEAANQKIQNVDSKGVQKTGVMSSFAKLSNLFVRRQSFEAQVRQAAVSLENIVPLSLRSSFGEFFDHLSIPEQILVKAAAFIAYTKNDGHGSFSYSRVKRLLPSSIPTSSLSIDIFGNLENAGLLGTQVPDWKENTKDSARERLGFFFKSEWIIEVTLERLTPKQRNSLENQLDKIEQEDFNIHLDKYLTKTPDAIVRFSTLCQVILPSQSSPQTHKVEVDGSEKQVLIRKKDKTIIFSATFNQLGRYTKSLVRSVPFLKVEYKENTSKKNSKKYVLFSKSTKEGEQLGYYIKYIIQKFGSS
eukprot:snap_masked-scaffold_16-processed-gene-2.29-mRNA-1 protein AED:0.48 eAED:0.51 QI:0/-1/0/1/-1/1/1/0/1575